ncbi:autotransporter outer membrane beta-barrel domain-containing protein [Chitinophaga barathri]|uniref:Uncharacterized protein n=1 Tax=Chitinophaga barathri TaxID=1647451 RepID=A0A3N4ME17_9BACT|nr:autotransporter outer membrane beta-barrel domain-containing protein [Chitinophaga barathri]RPD37949.1 hypothetical protein EG028_27400 [Chitinophaga barathri]
MNGQEPDIEHLLKAAALQEPEPAAPAVKQQAWEQLRHMLDVRGTPPPPSSGGGWWFLLAEVIVLLGTGLTFVLHSGDRLGPEREDVKKEVVVRNGKEMLAGEENKNGEKEGMGKDAEGDEKLPTGVSVDHENGRTVKDKSSDKHTAGNEGLAPDEESGNNDNKSSKENAGNNSSDKNTGENKDSGAGVGTGKSDRKSPGKKGGIKTNYKDPLRDKTAAEAKPGRNEEKTDHSKPGSTFSKGKRSNTLALPNNAAPTKAQPGSTTGKKETLQPDNPDAQQTISTGNPGQRNNGITGNENNIRPFTFHLQPVYPGTVPQKTINAGGARIAMKPHDFPDHKVSPFNIKAAVMAANNNTWAGNLQAEYTYCFSPKLAVRPSIGITYLTGAKGKYEHFYRNASITDTIGSPRRYTIDTARTFYTLKNTLHGNLGIQLTYETGKWSVYTGIAYQYQLMQKGKDSVIPGSYTAPLDTLPHFPDRFNANKLAGKNFFQWQAGVDYQLTPVLRIGLQYNLGWNGSAGGKGFVNDVPAYPNRQSLELHVRYFFKRKK